MGRQDLPQRPTGGKLQRAEGQAGVGGRGREGRLAA